jgi:fructose-1,6-bisphosphatase/inositol monophosphatase family enzyme
MKTDVFLMKVKEAVEARMPEVLTLRNQRTLKKDQSYVTSGDMLLHGLIRDLVAKEGPQARIVSEEDPDVGATDTAGYLVVVDPIDGTENFTSGLCEWGVSISCFEGGHHAGSLIGCPEMNLWLKTGEQFPRFSSRIRGLSSSLQKEDLIRATEGHEYRILGCCVYNMINVVRGSFLTFENPKGAHSWDILGGLNLALEHQLKVTVNDKPYQGEYLQADKKYRFRVENR